MHMRVVVVLVCVAAAVLAPTADAAAVVLERGDNNAYVGALQYLLSYRGYATTADNVFGSGTESKVRAFQRDRGLVSDGVVGSATWGALVTVLRKGKTNDAVRAAQLLLRDTQHFTITVDGVFGSGTERVVRSFQTNAGLSSSGVVDASTWSALVQVQNAWSDLLAIPASMTPRYSYARHSTMMNLFGTPGPFTTHCSSVTNNKLRRLMVTRDVGPMRVTGILPAVEALTRIFTRVRADHPDLHDAVSSAGMTCCRAVRGSTRYFSNHSWGTAVDLKIDGQLDPVNDDKAQRGLLTLLPYFEDEKFFPGLFFSREDAMHFEASDELVRQWKQEGWW